MLDKYEEKKEKITLKARAGCRPQASVYFAVVALTTVGFGDIVPTNDNERACALVLALLGAIIFAYCVGSISSLASEGSTTDARIEAALRGAHDFLHFRPKVDRKMDQLVKKHVLYVAKNAPQLAQTDWGDLLPRRVRTRIIEQGLFERLDRSVLLHHLDEDCRAHLASLLRPTYLPGQCFLFRALEVAQEMYWIASGECESLDKSETRVLSKHVAGEHFGDIGCFPVRVDPSLAAFTFWSIVSKCKMQRCSYIHTYIARISAQSGLLL